MLLVVLGLEIAVLQAISIVVELKAHSVKDESSGLNLFLFILSIFIFLLIYFLFFYF